MDSSREVAISIRRQTIVGFVLLALVACAMVIGMAPQPAVAAGSTLTNATPLAPADNGALGSQISVTGQPSLTTDVNVTLHGVTHTTPSELDILLQGPTGVRVMLMSDAPNEIGSCGGDASNITLTFDDAAAGTVPGNTSLVAGTYRPTDFDTGVGCSNGDADVPLPAPNGISMAAFFGTDPNGTWTLIVGDDTSGDSGSIAGGWSLNLTSSNSPADLTCGGLPATIVGTPGADTLPGTKQRDVIVGLGGDDVIIGKKGNDLLCGGEGNDMLVGGKGNDQLSGAAGSDACNGGAGKDRVLDGCEVQRKIP